MRPVFATPLALFSSYGWAQQLVAVAPPSDSSGLLVLGILAIAAGLVFLKVKRPEIFDKLLARGKQAAEAVEKAHIDNKIRDAISELRKNPLIPRPPEILQVLSNPVDAAHIALVDQFQLQLKNLRNPPVPEPIPVTLVPTNKIVNGQLMA